MRYVDPRRSAVPKVASCLCGAASAIKPDAVPLEIGLRSHAPDTRARLEQQGKARDFRPRAQHGHGCGGGFPPAFRPTFNDAAWTALLLSAARALFPAEKIVRLADPFPLNAEGFSFMLARRPGRYCFGAERSPLRISTFTILDPISTTTSSKPATGSGKGRWRRHSSPDRSSYLRTRLKVKWLPR